MIIALIKKTQSLIRLNKRIQEGRLVQAAQAFEKYKEYSAIVESTIEEKLNKAKNDLNKQTEIVEKMKQALN